MSIFQLPITCRKLKLYVFSKAVNDVLLYVRLLCNCRTPLHAAAYSGNVSGLQVVLAQGAEVNAVDHCGCSALMVAADRGHTMAVGM